MTFKILIVIGFLAIAVCFWRFGVTMKQNNRFYVQHLAMQMDTNMLQWDAIDRLADKIIEMEVDPYEKMYAVSRNKTPYPIQ